MTNEIVRDDAWFKSEAMKFNCKSGKDLNDEGALLLTETILSEIKTEMNHVIRAFGMNPDSKEVQASVKNMDDLLDSDYFNILTMGHGIDLRDKFRRKCRIQKG